MDRTRSEQYKKMKLYSQVLVKKKIGAKAKIKC